MQTIGNSLSQATQNLLESAASLLPGLFAAALALAVFLALARLAWGGLIAADRFVGTPRLARLAGGVAYYLLLGAGALVALDVLGVSPQSIATAFGLGGVALGFALRDIVSNLVAGVLLISSQEFAVGDQIVVGETEGTVEQVELRATHIRTYDGRMVIVPNGIIYNSRVINNTESPFRRASVFLHLGYGVDLDSGAADRAGCGDHRARCRRLAAADDAHQRSGRRFDPARSAVLDRLEAPRFHEHRVRRA